MITRIFIDNFRCFTNFETKPQRINLLIGANGTGKSTFVEVLHRVVGLSAMSESVEESFPAETYTRWDKRSVQRIEIDVTGNGGTYQYSLTLSRNLNHSGVAVEGEVVRYTPASVNGGRIIGSKRRKGTGKKPISQDLVRAAMQGANQAPSLIEFPPIGRDAMLHMASQMAAGSKPAEPGTRTLFMYEGGAVQLYDNDGNPGARFPFRGDRSFLPQLELGKDSVLLAWFLEFLRTMWLVKLNPTDIEGESEDESDTLDTDGANFAAWFRHLSQERPERLKSLFERIAEDLIGFSALRTVSSGRSGRRRELVADFVHLRSKDQLLFHELSDGERAIVILNCILLDAEAEPRTLLLDEPENFVGLEVIQPWLVALTDAIRDRDSGQLFVISHHPDGIDYLAADHTLLFERPGGGPSRVRADPFDRDLGLKASEIIGRGLLDAK